MSDTKGRAIAVVTGASSGIGAAFADVLAHRGFDLIVVARRGARLDALADDLRASVGVEIEVMVADLTDAADLRRVADRVAQEPRLSMLVNNAGSGDMGPFGDLSPGAIDRTIALNVTALAQLTHAALPILASRKGTIINVASVLAIVLPKGAALYAATKAFVTHFTRVLHEEVGDKVRLQALLAGVTRTEFFGVDTNGLLSQLPPDIIMEPRDLAEASLAGLELGELVCIPGAEDMSPWTNASELLRGQGKHTSSNRTATRYHRA